ncbi:MAG: hypothetical protein JWN79_3368 [Gemmatimonadetes bacterium]|nr:hypothetical protein [Gemmatimonadota bacterium]
MRPFQRLLCSLTLVSAACGGRATPTPSTNAGPQPPVRPLASLVSQQVIVAPTHSLREADPMGWTRQIPRSRELMRGLDSAITKELGERGLATQWTFPADLVRAAKSNPSFGQDPYSLSASHLRSGEIPPGTSVGNPLIMQLRTMVALQENARAVLLPVELRFERDSTPGQGVAVLRLALLDGRLGEVRWIGDVRSDPRPTFSREVLLTSIAAHLADLIAAP